MMPAGEQFFVFDYVLVLLKQTEAELSPQNEACDPNTLVFFSIIFVSRSNSHQNETFMGRIAWHCFEDDA